MGSGLILLAEDDVSIRAVVRRLLELQGHRVVECSTATAAVSALDRHLGDVAMVIADYALPDITGVRLAKHVTRTAPWVQTLIISGHRSVAAECKSAGAEFLPKPFGAKELLMAVGKLQAPRRRQPIPVGMPARRTALAAM